MIYETKANYGDTVFILKDNKLVECTVNSIIVKQYTDKNIIIDYKLKANYGNIFSELFGEHIVFLTKESLVKDLVKDPKETKYRKF